MSRLSVYLLGDFQVRLDGQNITRKFRTNKERALFAYLMVEVDRPHKREFLSDLFWPRHDEGSSRANLRQALLGIRKALEDPKDDPLFVAATEETVQINPDTAIWLDTEAFTSRYKASQDHAHVSILQCAACIQRLGEAADLYRQEFLSGLYLDESKGFHEWQVINREHYLRSLLSSLDILSEYYQNAGNFEQAQKYAWKYVHLDPLEEVAHRRLMELLALNGHRSAALEQFHTLAHILETELDIAPSDETIQLYKKIKLGDKFQMALPALDIASSKIPPQFTTFIGRESELETLAENLADPTCRLVNIVGPAGCGKTRLVVEAAQQAKPRFKDGVYFISAETLSSGDMLLTHITRLLGLTITLKEPVFGLIRFFQNKQALLVLDQFDGALEQVDLLMNLLRSAPAVKIMLASRQRLNMQYAQRFELSGLPYPADDSADDLLSFAAVKLFVQRARQARSSFTITPESSSWIARICQVTSGLPLALELAANHLRMYSCQGLYAELEKGLEILSTRAQDVLPTHRSFAAALQPSWEKLTNPERAVFARLSVFPDQFSLPAAESVAGASAEILISLVERSLLQETPERFFLLLPLIQKFAAAQLAAEPVLQQHTLQQHSFYYLKKLQEFASLNASSQAANLDRFEQLYENIRLAVETTDQKNPGALPDHLRSLWERYSRAVNQRRLTDHPEQRYEEYEFNSQAFRDQLRQSLSSAARKALPAAVLSLKLIPANSIDKDCNVKVCALLGEQLRRLLRTHDTVIQTELNVFGIILEDLSRIDDAYTVARKILKSLAPPLEVDGEVVQVNGQVGIGVYPIDGDEASQLLEKATASTYTP